MPAQVPVSLAEGCYWIPIPVDLVDVFTGITADIQAAGNEQQRSDIETRWFWLYPVTVGFAFDPPAYEVAVNHDGSFRLTPLRSAEDLAAIKAVVEGISVIEP